MSKIILKYFPYYKNGTDTKVAEGSSVLRSVAPGVARAGSAGSAEARQWRETVSLYGILQKLF